MRRLFLLTVLLAIGCSEAQKETSRESDPQLNYLQAAEEVKVEEKRLQEDLAEMDELKKLVDQHRDIERTTTGLLAGTGADKAADQQSTEAQKKIADALARGHKKIAEQEKRVAEARARRDALSSR